MTEPAVQHYLAEFSRLRDGRGGLGLDFNLGERAMAFVRQQGFPTTRQEDWKYTDVNRITKRRFSTVAEASPDQTLLDCARFGDLRCHRLGFVNGRQVQLDDDPLALPAGVTVQPLAAALRRQPALLEKLKPLHDYKHTFSALNLALLTGGAVIQLADNTQLDAPIQLVYAANQQTKPVAAHPFNLILIGKHSRAIVIESYVGAAGAEYFSNTQTHIHAAAGAQLDHYKIQQESLKAYHVGHTDITQGRDSTVTSHNINLGAALARNDIDVHLGEPGASVYLNGLYMSNGRQHIDNHTQVDHLASHTSSDEHYRGIMDGHARAVFNGKVVVHERTQKIEAHQNNANLLLSNHAEIDTKPQLEIYADDVKCSHGATVGRLDADMLFYLRARAIDEKTASSLLSYAFADEIIKSIAIAQLRAQLEYIVAGRLPDSALIKAFIS